MNASELPPWLQVLGTLVGFAAAAFAVFKGAFGKKGPTAAESRDVVVPGLAIADSVAIRQLAEEIRESNLIRRQFNEDINNLLYEIRRLNDQVEHIKHRMEPKTRS